MNQDFFQSDMINKYSNEFISVNSDIFNDVNYDYSLNNLKNNSSQNIASQNFYHLGSSIINFKNEHESKIESDKEIEKESSISNNFDNNNNNNQCCNNNYFLNINNSFIINNHSNCNNNSCNCNNFKYSQYIPFNDISLSEEDILLSASINSENSIFNNNNIYITKINNNKPIIINNKEIKKNDNDKENKLQLNVNEELNKNKNKNKKEQKISDSIEEELSINENINEKNKNIVIDEVEKKNDNNYNTKINLNIKKKIKKKKNENQNKIDIQYGHPKRRIFKTMKQKLNLHKKLDPECRNDTILIIYTISKLKNIIKSLEANNKIKNKASFERIKNLYKSYIIYLQHKEYAQNIIGYNLI